MEVIKVILLVVCIGLVAWLVIDTILYVIKKVKNKKLKQAQKDVEKVEDTTSENKD